MKGCSLTVALAAVLALSACGPDASHQDSGTVVGAIAGGVLGQRTEANVNNRPGFEITVRLDSGELRAITQAADELFRPGERVRLLSNGYMTRVTH